MKKIDAKDQAIAILGLLIILFVAGAIFFAHPRAISNNKGEVAGVYTENSIFPAVYSTDLQISDLIVNAEQMAQKLKAVSQESARKWQKAIRKGK